MSAQRFAGKVVVVTGAGHGIGRASALRFAAEGAQAVIVVDINAAGARETVRLIGNSEGRSQALVADVSDERAVESIRDQIAEAHGRVDIVHNNAGRLRAGSVTELSADDWDLTFAVNVRSMFLVCRALIPLMRPQGGAIVNTASSSGLVGETATPAYNASKAAIINLTRQLAADYSREGIRANCVCPGWVPTGFNDPVLSSMTDLEVEAMVTTMVPMGRQALPEEIAAAVAFLASEDASYIAGHALVVDGGLTAVR
jgi:NAD(P)-dependent dehydrogenase (short-subunit alcohol dehydrogenase family)